MRGLLDSSSQELPSLGTTELAGPISVPTPQPKTKLSKQHCTKTGGQDRIHQALPCCTLTVLQVPQVGLNPELQDSGDIARSIFANHSM